MFLLTHVQVNLVRILAHACRLVSLGIGVFVQKDSEAPIVRKKSRVSVVHCIEYDMLLSTVISFLHIFCFHSLAMCAASIFIMQNVGLIRNITFSNCQ
jgi:hypothetical protein